MVISAIYRCLEQIALNEFDDIVAQAEQIDLPTGDPRKLRLRIIDDSFVDIFVSVTGRYSYHWERNVGNRIVVFRHDNAPHKAWRSISTYPKHLHNGSETNVIESHISTQPNQAIREFCRFIRQVLRDERSG